MSENRINSESEEARKEAMQMHQNGADAIDKGTTARLSDEDENSSIDPGETVVEPIDGTDVGSTSAEEPLEGDTTSVEVEDPPPKVVANPIEEILSSIQDLSRDVRDLETKKGVLESEEGSESDIGAIQVQIDKKKHEKEVMHTSIAALLGVHGPVAPGNMNIWDAGKNGGHSGIGCMEELIDNPLLWPVYGVPMRIEVHLEESESNSKSAKRIIVGDNGRGIPADMMVKCLTKYYMKGKHGTKGPSEHGVGIKDGIRGLGRKVRIRSRTPDSGFTIELDTEDIVGIVNGKGMQKPFTVSDKKILGKYDHGLEITIWDLETKGKDLLKSAKGGVDHVRDLRNSLGVRYREHLRSGKIFGQDVTKGIRIYRHNSEGKLAKGYPMHVEGIYPLYGYNGRQGNYGTPVLSKFALHKDTDEWQAWLEIGKMPISEVDWIKSQGNEYAKEKKHPRRGKFDPYSDAIQNAGLDIVYRGIVIQKGFIQEHQEGGVGLDVGKRNVAAKVRGILELGEGFESKKEKVGIFACDNFTECIERVSDIIRGRIEGPYGEDVDYFDQYMKFVGDRDAKEARMRDSMCYHYRYMVSRPFRSIFWPRIKSAYTEQETDFGQTDIMINRRRKSWLPRWMRGRVVCEVKVKKARALDVYQVVKDMMGSGARRGILVSEEISDKALDAIDFWNSWARLLPWTRGTRMVIRWHKYTVNNGGNNENYVPSEDEDYQG